MEMSWELSLDPIALDMVVGWLGGSGIGLMGGSKAERCGAMCFWFQAMAVHGSGQIIATKPPVGHPKWWFSKGMPLKMPLIQV